VLSTVGLDDSLDNFEAIRYKPTITITTIINVTINVVGSENSVVFIRL
jgi:hypothetical protein